MEPQLPNQGSNLHPLHWKVTFQPLDSQGSSHFISVCLCSSPVSRDESPPKVVLRNMNKGQRSHQKRAWRWNSLTKCDFCPAFPCGLGDPRRLHWSRKGDAMQRPLSTHFIRRLSQKQAWELPGGPLVKTPRSQCRGLTGQGNLTPYARTKSLHAATEIWCSQNK